MWQYNYTPDPNELYHFGILGMKWGHRRWQNKDGSLTPAGYIHYYGHPRPKNETGPVYAPNDKRSSSEKSSASSRSTKLQSSNKSKKSNDPDQTERKGLTENQKKAIKIGLAVAGTALAAYGGYKLSRLYTGAGMKVDPTTGFRLINKEMSDLYNLSKINPGRIRLLSKIKNKEIIDGSSANCMLCTTAYELRKRGYDVHAGLSHTGYMPDDLFSIIFKDYKGTQKFGIDANDIKEAIRKINNGLVNAEKETLRLQKNRLDKLTSNLESLPKGSRGNIVVWWPQGGGHSMIWENTTSGIRFMDGQTNQVYTNFFDDIIKYTDPNKMIEILRTDNLKIDTDYINSGVTNFINSDTILKTYVDNGFEIAKNLYDEPIVRLGVIGTVGTAGTAISIKKSMDDYKKGGRK